MSASDADGLTIHGTYRHRQDGDPGPGRAADLRERATDRNGDNAVAGPVGNMRQLAEQLSDSGVASLRYDKVGTGKTGLGPYAQKPNDVVSAVYTAGAAAAVRYLADQPATDKARISVYGVGEGTIHAMSLATDTSPGAPKIHSLGLFQPLPGRYLDIITNRVRADGEPADTDYLAGGGRRNPDQRHRARAAARGTWRASSTWATSRRLSTPTRSTRSSWPRKCLQAHLSC